MKLELEIDVPESREVTLTLPPDTPVGKTKVRLESTELAPLPGISEKAQRERAAFYRLLPELLRVHRGKVVAIHEEQVIAVGDDRRAVIAEARKHAGYVDMYIASVLETQPTERLVGFREIGRVSP